jgi:[protein-PII] uridylyltransferase
MMFHDLGKGYGGDHDERGARMVVDIAERLQLSLDDSQSLEFLVRHHLTMSMLAQNRDIEDPHLVAEFVRSVGTLENLRYLYLLTFADMRAVGPQIWNGWKDHLLGELYQRSIEAFETGLVEEADLGARAERVRTRLLEEASGDDEMRRLREFAASLPDSYLLSNTLDRIIDHWRLYESLGTGLFRAGVTHYKERGFSELTVCTGDRPGLFVRLTGVLSANGLDILGAKIVTAENDVVIDTFRVDHGEDPERTTSAEVWAQVREDIQKALTGEIDVAERVAEARRRRASTLSVRKARKRAVTRVAIDNNVSPEYTVIDVYAADRPGLLFTVANSIYKLGLIIHLAKITTRVQQVLDVFYVTDAHGAKIQDRHEEISALILESILDADAQEPSLFGSAAKAV